MDIIEEHLIRRSQYLLKGSDYQAGTKIIKKANQMKKLEQLLLHPFLFGLYPVLALLAHNINQIQPIYAMRSILFILAFTPITLLTFKLILLNWRRSGLITSLALFMFFIYGRIFTAIQGIYVGGFKLGRNSLLLLAFMILIVGLAWLSFKIKDSLSIWTFSLNIFGLIVVFLPLTQIGWYLAQKMIPMSSALSSPSSSALGLDLQIPQGKTAPDIYYIILDMYTRRDALEMNLSYDNSSFLNALKQKGFYIADCSQSNYPSTYLSLTSSLNFNYVDTLNKQFVPPNTAEESMYPYLLNNSVRQVLKELGYKIIGFESGFSPDEFHDADEYLSARNDILGELTLGGLNPFESLLMQTSAGELAYAYSTNHPALRPFLDYSYNVFRNRMVFALKKLPDLASAPGPKFVYVHLLAPHNPFVFGSDGQVLTLNYPFSLNNDMNAATIYDFTTGYTAEVTYLNHQFLNIVDHIIQNSTTPPVIILQGDHGIPRLADWNMTILSAYYLPEGGEINLYSSISPVNSFRIIFNTYLGGHLPLLDDKACNFSKNGIYGCSLQIDPNPQCSLGNKP